MSVPPIPMTWDGDAFVPASAHWARLADKHFVVGQTYPLEVREDRSSASHRQYFSCINEAWQNLPDHLAERFATPDHLRKYALIKTGWRDERSIACSSKAEALRLSVFVRAMDDFAIVTVSEAVITVYTAKSQSLKAMGKADFQKSKDDVLGLLASMIGTNADELRKAGKAA